MELTKNEQAAVKYFAQELRTARGKDSAITLGYFVDKWNYMNPNQKINDASGKKIIRHIRDNGIIKRLMADRYGYFIADSQQEYEDYVDMIGRRAKRIMHTYKTMRNQ